MNIVAMVPQQPSKKPVVYSEPRETVQLFRLTLCKTSYGAYQDDDPPAALKTPP
jgi:hypothetical protein